MNKRNTNEGTWTALNQYLEINTASGECRLKDTKDIVPNLRYTIDGVRNYAVKSFKEKRSTDITTNTIDTVTDTLADTEEWRWVVGVKGVNEGEYKFKVSNLGRFANVETDEILTLFDTAEPNADGQRYKGVSLGGVPVRAHRAVALAFCYRKNPATQTQVHHRDGNPSNNHADNLEWVSPAEHSRIHGASTRFREANSKPVEMCNPDTLEVISTFSSVTEAHDKTGISISRICAACNGKNGKDGRLGHLLKTFYWRYK